MEFFREYSSEFGHVYAWSLGPLSQLVVNDPELLKDVLRTKQDCYHKVRAVRAWRARSRVR
jgi:hypothetical protein